ncbi:MAG: hypothetical protein AAF532_03770 [Planctomycetota bacterium]
MLFWPIKLASKVVVGGVVAATAGALLFGSDFGSYVRTGIETTRQAARDGVPVEFEIKRAERLIAEVGPEIDHCMHVIAEQQYDIERLERKIATKGGELETQKTAMLTLRADLDGGATKLVYNRRTFTADQVEADLARRLDRYKVAEQTLAGHEKLLAAKRTAVAKNEQKLDGMLAIKRDLVVELENLRARLSAVQAEEAIADVEIDDTRLSRAKELIDRLDRTIGTREKTLENRGTYVGEVPVEVDTAAADVEHRDVAAEIDAYFGGTDAPSTDA